MTNRVVSVDIAKIKELADEKGLTISGLERNLKLPHNRIQRWKKYGANVNSLYIVSEYFGVTMNDLIKRV